MRREYYMPGPVLDLVLVHVLRTAQPDLQAGRYHEVNCYCKCHSS
jgi:hypothetical protein